MAGVKTQKGGPRVEPRWRVRDCYICERPIETMKDALHVRRFLYPDGRRREHATWSHRNCFK